MLWSMGGVQGSIRMALHHRRRRGYPPTPDQRDHRGKTRNLPLGISGRAIFGTQIFGSQSPPPSRSNTSLGLSQSAWPWNRTASIGDQCHAATPPVRVEDGGVRDPQVCAPKKTRSDFPDCRFRFLARWSLWSGGGDYPPLPPPSSHTLPRNPMPLRTERIGRAQRKLGRGKGMSKGI